MNLSLPETRSPIPSIVRPDRSLRLDSREQAGMSKLAMFSGKVIYRFLGHVCLSFYGSYRIYDGMVYTYTYSH